MTPTGRTAPGRPSRRTRLTSSEIRDRLFEAALTHFRDSGYEETSVSRLTRETGVAKGTFFNHFPTKEHVLSEFAHRVWNEAKEEADAAGHQGTDAIIRVLDGMARRLESDPGVTRALAGRLPGLPGPPGARAGDDAEEDGLVAGWSRWIEEGIRGSLPIAVPLQDIAPSDLAPLLSGALVETLREAAGRDDGGRRSTRGHPRLGAVLGRRVVFLLRSAGFMTPDPPPPSKANR